ncbi:ABC transporter permease subunit [Effusibacillus lacus]|uniref:Copper ABC transporter permease n=1 Tax=Effusibacillus lacus TaxID=1348429 RepID=A0A292YSJ3_9BACL|nr:ABC transporter permease subunit [Effusibacillus lacus]TCS76091.1 ABC-2 type transport system permease protein [Effusibacillus lacus]GAX91394.1 copper ABC transporter permease [Effusibacillus lacus]
MTYVWKEWKEQSRGIGMWLSLGMVMLASVFTLLQSRTLPAEQGFEAYLLSLYDLNLFLIPLLSLFLASFSLLQEKEQKTILILLTKKESYRSFLWKKAMAVQFITLAVFAASFVLLAVPAKFVLAFDGKGFLAYLIATFSLLLIFNQIGMLLGSVCTSRLQLVGANLFAWFLFLFLTDLAFLYWLPGVTRESIRLLSVLYFLIPMHTIRLYLESSLGLFPLDQLSGLMQKMIWLSPLQFLLINLVLWTALPFELAVRFHRKGEKA